MNVLIINSEKKERFSGIEIHNLFLSVALKQRGHNVYIACHPDGYISKKAAESGVNTVNIEIKYALDFFGVFKVAKSVYKKSIEYIVINYGKHYWPMLLLSRLLGVKNIVVRHQLNKLKKKTNWLLNKYATEIVGVSSAVKEILIKSSVSSTKIAIIHNGIDLKKFDPDNVCKEEVLKDLKIGKNIKIVGTVCRLKKEKGVYELLYAFNELTRDMEDLKLLYVGDGPEMPKLNEKVKELGLSEKVIFLGQRDDVNKIYSVMDVFVLPSTSYESFGLVIAEAMAMGVPVVATCSGGVLDIVKDGYNGLLVSMKDVEELKDSILRLLTDEQLCARLIDEGKRSVKENFNFHTMAQKFEELMLRKNLEN